MTKMTGKQICAQLRTLRDQAGTRHYERVALASQLLRDAEWVEDPSGGGDENTALDRIEAEYFGDLCGIVSLTNLLDLHRHYPDVADWQRHRFDLKKMWAECRARERPTPRHAAKASGPRPVPKDLPAPAVFEQHTPAVQKQDYARALKAVESKDEKIARLETRIAELEEENRALKARLKGIIDQARSA